MNLINIYPLKNQNKYADEPGVMILAHLLNQYNPEYFNEEQFVILDNGLYEGSQVSPNISYLIEMAENSPIHINEIVIPDTFFNMEETIEKFENSLEYIRKYSDKYSFMFVAQSRDLNELERNIEYINQYPDLNITLGIPKKAPYDRGSKEAIEIYKRCIFPIHFLGLEDDKSFEDLLRVKDIIRSCDTSQICTMLLNDHKPEEILGYVREKESKVIDLVEDCVEEEKINNTLDILNQFEKDFLI